MRWPVRDTGRAVWYPIGRPARHERKDRTEAGRCVVDIVMGSPEDADGTVWIFFLNADGTVKDEHRIEGTTMSFSVPPVPASRIGATSC